MAAQHDATLAGGVNTNNDLACSLISSLTLGLVHPDDDHAFVPPDTHQFVDGTNAPPRQLAQHDHALDVVVLKQAYIRAHLRDGAHVHHHHVFQLRITMLVKPTRERHLLSCSADRCPLVLSREFWSWKVWSGGPKFSLENMVRLVKNRSGLKTLILSHLSATGEYKTTLNQRRICLGNSQRTWGSLKQN